MLHHDRAAEERRFSQRFAEQIDDPRSLEHKFRTHVIRRLLEVTPLHKDTSILDLGCGSGYLLAEAAKQVTNGQLVGVDISEAMIQRARQKMELKGVEFMVADIVNDSLPESWKGRFDIATATFSFHHWGSIETLSKIASVLKPGARFYVADVSLPAALVPAVNKLALLSGSAVNAGYEPREKVLAMFKEAGFKNMVHRWLVFPMLLISGEKQ